MGRAENAEVNIAGCGDADLEGVSGEIALAMAGSSDVRLYDAGTASVSSLLVTATRQWRGAQRHYRLIAGG